MDSIVVFVMLLTMLLQYPQPAGDISDEDARLRMEARAKQLEWERIRLEQEGELLTLKQEQLTLKQVQLLQHLAVAVLLVLVLVLCFIAYKSSLRREEHEEENNGANEEEVGNFAADEEDPVGNEDGNEPANAENNNDVARVVQDEDDDTAGRVLMERIQWPVQNLERGCKWTLELMDNYIICFACVLSDSFYPVLQPAIGVGSAFEGWSPREQDVEYQVLIPMIPPQGHSFHLELDSAGQRRVRNFRVRVQLECTCTREQRREKMLCFLHHPEEELKRNQDPSLLDTLCTDSYLDVQKTARWFYQLMRAIWPALPQSHNWHLVLLPSRRSCRFKVTNGKESFNIEMFFGVQRGDSDIFVSSQPREACTQSTTWPETYAVAEKKFFQHIARQAPTDSLHLKCLQFFTRLHLGFVFSTYTTKTIVMHLLNVASVSHWRRRHFQQRLLDISECLRLCVQAKHLNHFIVGNRRLPREIKLPPDVQMAKGHNLFHGMTQQPAAHRQAISDYQVLHKWFERILLGEE